MAMLPMNASFPNGQSDTAAVPKIAIIGAGITGASAAHHLHHLCRLYHRLDVTVFEGGSKVGGRIRSAFVHNEAAYDVESGATSFSDDDWCLKDAMQEVGLKPTTRVFSHRQVGVWDGHDMILSYANDDRPLAASWWHSLKWLWKYGRSLQRLRNHVVTTGKCFSGFFSTGYTLKPGEQLQDLLGHDDLYTSASSYFERESTDIQLVDEIIRAECRHRYACDLYEINALSAKLILRQNPEVAIYQGNQRLPHRMLKISEAKMILNTQVTDITPGQTRRWKLHAQSTTAYVDRLIEEEFDIVIVTSSFATSGIKLDPPPSAGFKTATKSSYVDRHVTLFSTLEELSPSYFGLPKNTTLPEKILTAPRGMSKSGMPPEKRIDNYSEGNSTIYSITVVARVPPPDSFDSWDKEEHVYKIVSSRSVSDDEIANMLGHELDKNSHLEDLGVTWIHRQEWTQAYPKSIPDDRTVGNMEIAPDLYYTATAMEVYNTMEMGCRMGLNLAKHLYYSKWTGESYP